MTDSHSSADAFDCSIIIPTRDQLNFLKPCIDSILDSCDGFTVEVIVVDNDSEQPETREYLDSLRQQQNFQILSWGQAFNFSAINNFAANHANSKLLCFLNNDVEITDRTWLAKLLPLARREDVGAVGCILLYPDSTIQHAGIALDERSIGKHIALGEVESYLSDQGISAPVSVDGATAACLLMRRELFLRMQGFNEKQLSVAFNDVDLCLRLTDKGLPVLLHPDVKLLHHESVSRKSDELPANRKRAVNEFNFMQSRWRHRLKGTSYDSGIPTTLAKLAKDSGGELQAMLAMATDALFRENELPDESTDSSTSALRTGSSGFASNADWQRRYQELEERYSDLEGHARRVEQAHHLIESSIFWRLTAPLRNLRDRLRGQSAADNNEPQSTRDSSTTPAKDETPSSVAAPLNNDSNSKARYDRQAKTQLSNFLHGKESLKFPFSDSPRVSILLVFYNQAHLSLLCLQSIIDNADVDYELIIVDNASTDASSQLLDSLENVVVIRNTDNLGFVKAVNIGAERARGEYLLLLNNDAMLETGSLSSAVDAIEAEGNIGAVGGKIKLLDGSLQEAGSIIWNDGACLGYGRGANPDAPEFNFKRDVDYCSGAFLLFSTALFRELNGFDEEFAPAYYEESDFCIRLQERGLRVVYEPEAAITHYEFASSGGLEGASALQASHRDILCRKHEQFLETRLENNPDNILKGRFANAYPNVLIIDDRVPHPSLGAGYPRCAHILAELGKMPLNISFYPLLYPEDDWEQVYSTLPTNIEVLLGRGRAGLLSFLQERKGCYQFIMVSRVHNMEFFNHTLATDSELIDEAEIIYDAEAVTAPREVLQRKLWGEKLSDQQEDEMIEAELAQARIATKVVAVSENEARLYEKHGYENTVVLGHTLEPTLSERGFDSRDGLLFVGALRDEGSPNVDSLLWFVINALPIIERSLPDIRITVVGDNSAPSLLTIDKDNLEFTGRLDSIEELYDSHRVFIAPTRFAAGIPHKVHEAASKGLPSVTTALLAQQLGWSNEQHLLVGDSAEAFAEQCVRLHQDQALWQEIRANGLEAVASDCSQQTFESSLKSLFNLPA